jgi:N-acetyl sugar amidotransferase
MNPLTVTWAPHLYTDIGWKNFSNWMHEGGLDNLLYTPNGKLHRLLTRLAFKNLLHPFQPFIIGQRLIGPSIASKFGVNLIMYGENQAEYGNNIKDNNSPEMQDNYFSVSSKESIYLGGLSIKEIMNEYNFNLNDFVPYFPINNKLLNTARIDYQYLGYYLKWDPQECYYYASENTGFQSNTERTQGSYSKYSSIDDKIDPFHYYTTLIKFGLGRASYDASQEIRNDKITREEGIALVKKYDQELPTKYLNDFLKYISIDESEFWSIIDKFRPNHLWSKTNGKWVLNHTVHD